MNVFDESSLDAPPSIKELEAFIRSVDDYFLPPLSTRIDLNVFSQKMLRFGHVVALRDASGRIVSAGTVYCNDHRSRRGYIPFLATRPEAQGQGLACTVLATLMTTSKGNGMTSVELEVHASNSPALRLYRAAGFTEQLRESALSSSGHVHLAIKL